MAPKLSSAAAGCEKALGGDGTCSRPDRSADLCAYDQRAYMPQTQMRPWRHSSPRAPDAAHCVSRILSFRASSQACFRPAILRNSLPTVCDSTPLP